MKTIVAAAFSFFYIALPGSMGAVPPAAAIVIGTVLRGKAFVSSDRTYVYPDYQVRVDRVLKQDTSASLAVGEQIVVSRGGGAIHF